jgi:hypothetical protein
MCFSAPASFIASVVVGSLGVWSSSLIHSRKQVGLGIIPFHFSLHQFIEGLMWLNLEGKGAREVSLALGYVYTFLSGFVWPIWMPACLIPLTTKHKRTLWGFVFSGVIFASYSYYLILKGGLEPRIMGGHIDYTNMTLYYFIIYCFISITPFFLVQHPAAWVFKVFGVLLFSSFLAGYIIHIRCAASIWCFFAAISSIWILILLRELNKKVLSYEETSN